MNAVVKLQNNKNASLIQVMASKFNMDPDKFATTVRQTCMPSNHTDVQFAALLMVAHEHGLNPILKELYAFPAKGGGIVPIVSVDGWAKLINSNKHFDGCTFEFDHSEKGELISCTCKMHRKDRSHPIEITEFYEECKRNTDPWKMKHRMLRHKAFIQTGRIAFSLSGIYDEEEGSSFAEPEANEKAELTPPPPPVSGPIIDAPHVDNEKPKNAAANQDEIPHSETAAASIEPDKVLGEAEEWFNDAKDPEALETAWGEFEHLQEKLGEDDAETLKTLYVQRMNELEPNTLAAG